MSQPLALSIAFQTDKTPAEYVRLGELVDEYEFDVVSVYNDMLYQPALGPLLYLAQNVKRAKLGPAALNPFTAHPVEIAGQIALLDMATNGRAYLGLARGAWLDSVGIHADHGVTRLRETVEMVRYLLSRRTDGYQGECFGVAAGVTLQYATLRSDMPVMLGTWGPRTMHLAGEIADEVKIGGSANPALLPIARQWIASSRVSVCVGAVSVVDRDRAAARALARRQVAPYLAVVAELDPTLADDEWVARIKRHAAERDYAAIARDTSEAMLDRFAFAGTPDDLVAQVRELSAAGANRVEFGTPHGIHPYDGIRLLGAEVLPRIRQ
jgi:5,10-methylenetetrahydromethanopterin reductase